MVGVDHTHPPSHGTLEQTKGVDEKDKRDGLMDGWIGKISRS